MITVVTSFNEDIYRAYGKDFVESFNKYWDKSIKLAVFYEGTNLREGWFKYSEVEGLQNWLDAIACFDLMSGSIAGEYNINFDARMVRKPFIQAHACKKFGGKVFWLDADTITFDRVTPDFINATLPNDKMNCYLGRDNNKILDYTESGYLGFNTEHPMFEKFMNLYINIFTSGTIFAQKGWHDCYGFDAARKMYWLAKPQSKEWFNDLAKDLPPNTHHPFINSVLGSCLDHRKGARKDTRSTAQDLIKPRKEPYWNASLELPSKKSDGIMSSAIASRLNS